MFIFTVKTQKRQKCLNNDNDEIGAWRPCLWSIFLLLYSQLSFKPLAKTNQLVKIIGHIGEITEFILQKIYRHSKETHTSKREIYKPIMFLRLRSAYTQPLACANSLYKRLHKFCRLNVISYVFKWEFVQVDWACRRVLRRRISP